MLRQRADQAIAAEQALALAHNEYNQRLTLLENTRQRLEVTLQAAQKNKLDIFEVRQFSFYRTSLNEKINRQEKDVKKASRIVEHKRKQAVQARQAQQVLEKLKEQYLQNYRREMADREQKEIDELSLNAYQRRNKQLPPN